jgi:hypothetical protein
VVDQFDQIIDVMVSDVMVLARPGIRGRLFGQALKHGARSTEVDTDQAPVHSGSR